MTERDVQAAIMTWLRKQPDTFAVKFAAGPYTLTGVPDILVCVAGRFLALEVKWQKGRTTPIQRIRLDEITAAGGRAHVVRSLSEAQAAWKELHSDSD